MSRPKRRKQPAPAKPAETSPEQRRYIVVFDKSKMCAVRLQTMADVAGLADVAPTSEETVAEDLGEKGLYLPALGTVVVVASDDQVSALRAASADNGILCVMPEESLRVQTPSADK